MGARPNRKARPKAGSGSPRRVRPMTPQEYSQRLRATELASVLLEELRAKVNWAIQPKESAPLAIDEDFSLLPYQAAEQLQPVACAYTLTSKVRNRLFVKVAVRLRLQFRSADPFNERFFGIFRSHGVGAVAWPFLRELASSLTARMGLPPLTLPLRVTQPPATGPAQRPVAAAGPKSAERPAKPGKAKRAKKK